MIEPATEMPPARSFLYVPGDQPDMLAKADQRGVDALIDLEDAVPPDVTEMRDRTRHPVSALPAFDYR